MHRTTLLLASIWMAFAFTPPGHAAPWEGPFAGLTYVQIDKALPTPDFEVPEGEEGTATTGPGEAEPLPQDVLVLLGSAFVDYPEGVAAHVLPADLPALETALEKAGLAYSIGLPREIQLPQHEIEPTDPATRVALGFPSTFPPLAVPGRFVVQFAYPVQEEWLDQLGACGMKVLAAFAQRAFLVLAPSETAITSCAVASYLAWVDTYLTTDRVSPEFFAEANGGFSLQFTGGVNLAQKGASLATTMTLGAVEGGGSGESGFVEVTASGAALAAFAKDDPDLLSVTYSGTAEWSDERVGLIVAGRAGTSGTLGATGYLAWLESRRLSTPANQQVVAIFDSGYDRGSPGLPVHDPLLDDHHPDLENPERLVLLKGVPNPENLKDKTGHGTMVAGIVAGAANPVTLQGGERGGGVDSLGYAYGTGIAPMTRLAVVPMAAEDIKLPARQDDALKLVFGLALADRAATCNQSWNLAAGGNQMPAPNPLNTYDLTARFFDERALDANVATSAKEPMTFVFSAGNYAYQFPNGPARFNTVASPATAKNVIAVGATTSWRPASAVGGPAIPCAYTMALRPPDQDAPRADVLGLFSGRGRFFGGSTGADIASRVRIKPDLVAPGVRGFSTVPFGLVGVSLYDQPVGCTKYEPSNVDTGYYYTYGSGTSFAAPVVSGVAALLRKWFLDKQQNNPSPALLKAAMIATADSLGHVPGQDHRPSPLTGWGRVSLDRLTDPVVQRFWNDNPLGGVATLGVRQWTRTIGNPALGIYITIAWSDPPAGLLSGPSAQGALVNDLNLTVEVLDAAGLVVGTYYGNLFRENVVAGGGRDTGFSWKFLTPLTGSDPRDSINNVEGVFIPPNTLAAGRKLRIRVTGQNVPMGPQRFAIYAYNVQPAN